METFKSIAELEREKGNAQDIFYSTISELYIKEGLKCIAWFKERYPKRTIKWVEGMGTAFWVIDDKILQWEVLTIKHSPDMWKSWNVDSIPDRKARKLIPLWNFYKSFFDVTYTFGQIPCTGDLF